VNIETIAATILFSLGGFYYCNLILDGSVHPAFATWLIFFIAVAISFSSYLLKRGARRMVDQYSKCVRCLLCNSGSDFDHKKERMEPFSA